MIRIFTVSFLTLLAFGGVASGQVTALLDREHPVLRSEAVVTGDLVRIGDLIDHAGVVANIPIFRAPDLGQTGSVSAARVIEAVRAHGLALVETRGISDIAVTRLSRVVSAKDLAARIAAALAGQAGVGEPKNRRASLRTCP